MCTISNLSIQTHGTNQTRYQGERRDMKIRRIAATVLAVTSLVGGLTACGNSSSADSGTTVKVGVVGDSNEVW
ncbi:hypothetical protein ABJB48_05230, partial [Bifidobacterium bifidum]